MFKHDKALLREVKVERPNPQYAVLMQEQLGGGNGELKAAMQYLSQSFRIKDPEIKDLFLDINKYLNCGVKKVYSEKGYQIDTLPYDLLTNAEIIRLYDMLL